jgi:hypothetical protein
MPEIHYYVCDGPECEATEPATARDGNGRTVENMSFTRVTVQVARWPGMKTGAVRFCSARCLAMALAPGYVGMPTAGLADEIEEAHHG